MKRIVFTVAIGKDKYAEMAMGLARSLQLIGDDTPRAVLTDNPRYDWHRYFDTVITPERPEENVLLAKLRGLEVTDADQVLFIDADCLAFKRLDAIFDACAGAPMAACGSWRSSGIWYEADIAALCERLGVDQIPFINTGVLYYDRSPEAKAVIERAREFPAEYGSYGLERLRGQISDEPCISFAMATLGQGIVIPANRDFHITGVGLIGKLRLDVLKGECRFLMRGDQVRLVEPTIFHAHYFSRFAAYWRQLDKLKWVERYEDAHPPRWMPGWWRVRRSVERRLLEVRKKL